MHAKSVRTAVVAAVTAMLMAFCAFAQSAPSASGTPSPKQAVKKPRKRSPVKPDSAAAGARVAPVPDSLTAADKAVASPQVFDFRVTTEPESVQVLLDDSLAGFSPCSLSGVIQGSHVLTLRKTGYYLKRAEFVVDSALQGELSFVLLKPAFLRVTSKPEGAVLYLDGEKEGTTPFESDRIKPGDHKVKAELKTYTTAERAFTVDNGGRDTVNLVLERTRAYRDSVTAAQQAAEKLRKDRFTFTMVSALASLGAILLIILEANNN